MACYECNFFYYDECEGCETCHYEQECLDKLQKRREQIMEEAEVDLWLAEMAYEEADHLAWLELLDMEESEVK